MNGGIWINIYRTSESNDILHMNLICEISKKAITKSRKAFMMRY